MIKAELINNKKLGLIDVLFNGVKFGTIDDFQGKFSYFPVKQDKHTGDHYIAVGEELNKLTTRITKMINDNCNTSIIIKTASASE